MAHTPSKQSAMALMFKPYRDYGLISGRSRRKEYWLFVVLCVAAYFVAGWLEEQPHLLLGYDRSGDLPISGWQYWSTPCFPSCA